MTYSPPAGTIPHKVIEFLRSKPAGFEASTAELAEAIGQENLSLSPYLVAAREHGVLKTDKRSPTPGAQHTLFWSLGGEFITAKPADPQPKKVQKPIVIHTIPTRIPTAKPAAVAKPERPATQQKQPIFGWFSDGSMVIRQPGAEDVTLSPAAAADLKSFISRQCGIPPQHSC